MCDNCSSRDQAVMLSRVDLGEGMRRTVSQEMEGYKRNVVEK